MNIINRWAEIYESMKYELGESMDDSSLEDKLTKVKEKYGDAQVVEIISNKRNFLGFFGIVDDINGKHVIRAVSDVEWKDRKSVAHTSDVTPDTIVIDKDGKERRIENIRFPNGPTDRLSIICSDPISDQVYKSADNDSKDEEPLDDRQTKFNWEKEGLFEPVDDLIGTLKEIIKYYAEPHFAHHKTYFRIVPGDKKIMSYKKNTDDFKHVDTKTYDLVIDKKVEIKGTVLKLHATPYERGQGVCTLKTIADALKSAKMKFSELTDIKVFDDEDKEINIDFIAAPNVYSMNSMPIFLISNDIGMDPFSSDELDAMNSTPTKDDSKFSKYKDDPVKQAELEPFTYWGWLNSMDDKTRNEFKKARQKHDQAKKEHPEDHKDFGGYVSRTGNSEHIKCRCGFEYYVDMS